MYQPITQLELRPGLSIDRHKLTALCQHWKIAKLELFGSVLRDDFRDDSDIDFLVTWQANSRRDLFEFVAMHEDFSQLFDRRVDLVSRKSIETSHNFLRQAAILGTAQPFYPEP
jgi:predicted nucleotidyltransferase